MTTSSPASSAGATRSRVRPWTRVGLLWLVGALFSGSLVACQANEGTKWERGGLQTARTPVGGAVRVAGRMPHATVWVGPICTDDEVPITVTRIEPVQATGGLRVVDFVVTPPGESIIGFSRRGLDSLYPDLTSHVVKLPCAQGASDPTVGVEREDLNLELSKPAGVPASAKGFRAFYQADGAEKSVDVLFSFYVCEAPLNSHTCRTFSRM